MKKIICIALLALGFSVNAQQPLNITAEEDRKQMMEQLGIKATRPGYNADEKAANPANYDEAKANPYSELPDVLKLKNGTKVTTPDMWWKQRRPEIAEDFEREVYGRVPKNVPQVIWKEGIVEREFVGFTPVIAKEVIGHVDNTSFPAIQVDINMTVVLPVNAKGPVPVLIMFGRTGLPNPVQPTPEDMKILNDALRDVLSKDPEVKKILDKYPAYSVLPRLTPSFGGEPTREQQLIQAGWGYVSLDPASIQADNGAGLTKGIIGLVNKGQNRKPDDWGALRAWAWGASRALDYLEKDPMVDAKHVGIEGVSRYGKAALVAMAFEPRFAMVLVGSSGKGGSTLHRRVFGEGVENLAGGFYYWVAGNYIKYAASDSKQGAMNASNLPVDSHELIALCAPRLTFISYGIPEKGDAKWLDQQGSYMATVAAGSVFKLLGAKDIGVTNDYKTEKMPAFNTGMLEGELAWRQHDGGHTDAPNMKYFIEWANGKMGRR